MDRDRGRSDDYADAKDSGPNNKQSSKDEKGLVPRQKLSAAGEEAKKIIKWLSFAKSNVSFGFQHLGPAYLPLMSEDRRGYSIFFDKISGWNVPQSVIKAFGDGDFEIIAQLSLSFYQITTNTFFGSTWMSPAVSLGNSKRLSTNILEFDCNDIVYFLTRIIDPACVAVIEVVVSKLDPTRNIVLNRYGCGWTMLEIFGKSALDVSDVKDNVPLQSCSIFSGSPRDMLMNTDIKALAKLLKEIPKCSLFYKLYGHRRLLKLQKLVCENEIIGRYDEIAGLVAKEIVLPNTTRAKWTACLGDEERLDEANVVHIYPTLRPKLAMPMKFKIANCQLFIPKRPLLEDTMIKTISKVNPKADKITILQRTLKVGLHNGHVLVGAHWIEEKLKEDKDDSELLLTEDPVINLYGYVPDSYMALVFAIEYQLGVSIPDIAQHDSKSLIASVTKKDSQEFISTSLLGTAVFIPYDGKTIRSTNKYGEKGPDDVDIEIKVLKDETCEILSPSPLVQENLSGININSAANLLTSSVTDLKHDSSAQDKSKNRLSYVRESKSGLTIKDKEKNNRADMNNEAMLGFDLRITHPIRGDIKNEENVESLTKIEERIESSGGVKSEDEAEEDKRPVRESYDSDKDKTVRGPRITSSGHKRYDDDTASVVESIVSTDERGRSYLNVDRILYDSIQNKVKSDHQAAPRDDVSEFSDLSSVRDRFLSQPREKSHLYSQALNAKVYNDPESGRLKDELVPSRTTGMEDSKVASKTLISVKGNEHYFRELTRGTKSRLNRYGVQDSVIDTAYAVQQQKMGNSPHFTMKNRLPFGNKYPAMDLELEIYDNLCVHEINIQFAGFRPRMVGNEEGINGIPMSTPRALYFSFQFYTCAPTRTEAHRVLQAKPGEVHVLVRDDPPEVRDEPPLTMRYIIDCSQSSPYEAIEFIDYLANKSLYVDVWDADALLYLGTIGIPMRMLMRQTNPMVKNAIECDIINGELSASNEGGVTVLVVTENGPVVGETVGSVSVILTNYGREGKGPNKPVKGSNFTSKPIVPIEGLNWRAHGIDDRGSQVQSKRAPRPKNSVRAKPLTETAPDLSKALTDLRQYASASSPRSLASNRNFKGNQTLNYDEILIIYRRFEGNQKGTVQYAGPLMILMDIPSYPIILKKFIKAYKSYNDVTFFREELLRFSNANEELKVYDVEEMIKVVFEKTGIKSKPEERILLAQKIVDQGSITQNLSSNKNNQSGYIKVKHILEFASNETDRADWLMVNKRLQLCVQKAELSGIDVEQMLSDFDDKGLHHISIRKFRDFLNKLSLYGKLTTSDISLCCRYFSKNLRKGGNISNNARFDDGEEKKNSEDEGNTRRNINQNNNSLVGDEISLHEVMAVLGKVYVGNIQFRLQKYLQDEKIELKYILRYLNNGNTTSSSDGFYTYDQIESLFRSLQIFANVLNHQQFEMICMKLDIKKLQKISLVSLLNYLGIQFKASDLPSTSPRPTTSPRANKKDNLSIDTTNLPEFQGELTTEFLLNLLLQKVRENGIAVDQAFRHFDLNGDGTLTMKELEQGLLELEIFNSIPNWKSQIPKIVKQFDTNKDGTISLREFFLYLGIKDYSPNILQRLIKIFTIAMENNSNQLSLKEIFSEFDEDKNGTLDAKEVYMALTQKLGTSFQDVTMADCEALVKQFDDNGDKKISIDEFIAYFNDKIKEGLKARKLKQLEATKKRFREIMLLAKEKGGITLKQIFDHLDKDKGGTVSINELFAALKELPNFKGLFKNENDLKDLLTTMDTDGSGDISLDEFESFINEGSEYDVTSSTAGTTTFRTIYDQIRETFGAAQAKGLSFEQFFNLIDKDASGSLSMTELEKILKKIPSFQNISSQEVRVLFDMIDTDKSGMISVQEFKSFVQKGKQDFQQDKQLQKSLREQEEKRKKEEDEDRKESKHDDDDEESKMNSPRRGGSDKNETIKEKFLRHMRKTAEYNGGIRNIFANLDYDGDGLILFNSLIKFLKSEDFFDIFTMEQISILLEKFFTKDKEKLYVIPLIQWLNGEDKENNLNNKQIVMFQMNDNESESKSNELPEYNFSTNPEIKMVERKLRSFGQVLSSKGVDVENKFQFYDLNKLGFISRSDFLKVLSELGIYLLEEGKMLQENQGNSLLSQRNDENFIKNLQKKQISLLKGGSSGDYLSNAPKMARKLFNYDNLNSKNQSEFKNHLESLTLIDWYRQGQKQMLLQQVLSHSLAHTMHIYPRFGKTLFFEYPIHNPFNHEERFEIEINDPELRLVTSFEEWLFLRKTVKPCVGELGSDPVEVEMFDFDTASNRVNVTLLPNEILYIPFTFMTLIPTIPAQRKLFHRKSSRLQQKGKDTGNRYSRGGYDTKEDEKNNRDDEEDYDNADNEIPPEESLEDVQRSLDVKIISGSHGHLVAILRIHIHPRPFIINRVLRFQEYENSVAKRKIKLVGINESNYSLYYPGNYLTEMKYIHCVENSYESSSSIQQQERLADKIDGTNSRVVIEWGSRLQESSNVHQDDHLHSLDMFIRYRCYESSSIGMFYLLIYNDPYQSELHETWQVIMNSRLRLDVHGTVGTPTVADLVIRGDKYPRRVKAYANILPSNHMISFKPDSTFQLVPGAYNRIMATILPKQLGYQRALINVVDADSRELLSVWLTSIHATAPAVMRSYDVEVGVNKPLFKKILFKNLWDSKRKLVLSSSDETLMRPRMNQVEIGPQSTDYLRLWFNGWPSSNVGGIKEVYLFLNDAVTGQNEECNLFRIRLAT